MGSSNAVRAGKRSKPGSKAVSKQEKRKDKTSKKRSGGKRLYYIVRGRFAGFKPSETEVGTGVRFVEGLDRANKVADALYGPEATIVKCSVKTGKMKQLGILDLVRGSKKVWQKEKRNSVRYKYRCDLGEMCEVVVTNPGRAKKTSIVLSGIRDPTAQVDEALLPGRKSRVRDVSPSSSESPLPQRPTPKWPVSEAKSAPQEKVVGTDVKTSVIAAPEEEADNSKKQGEHKPGRDTAMMKGSGSEIPGGGSADIPDGGSSAIPNGPSDDGSVSVISGDDGISSDISGMPSSDISGVSDISGSDIGSDEDMDNDDDLEDSAGDD